MRTNDNPTSRDTIIQAMQTALSSNDAAGYTASLNQLIDNIADGVRADFQAAVDANDGQILSGRGVRQLTSAETAFYQAFGDAIRSDYPEQAIKDANLALPITVINSVFDDMPSSHPLLAEIDFIPASGSAKVMYSTCDSQGAVWGDLSAKITKEIAASFVVIDAGPFKLSAFIPVCKDIVDMGPEWLDRFVRDIMAEQIAVGLEKAIITGTGKNMPIGMDRNVGPEASVLGGVYPQKDPESITDFSPKTVGDLTAKLAKDEAGNSRPVNGLILVVNTQDYLKLVMPATTTMALSGTYQRDVLPIPVKILKCEAVASGEAIFGLGKRYFMTVGSSKGGRVEYSDQAAFLDDTRLYKIKYHGNGRPKDNNAFLRLNISGLKPIAPAPAAANV